MKYSDFSQRFLYRGGANDGFHEAIGDTIQLSVLPPFHLHEVGLLPNVSESYEQLINFQMTVALDKSTCTPKFQRKKKIPPFNIPNSFSYSQF